MSIYELLKHIIPADHSEQVTAEYYIEQIKPQKDSMQVILDLGCGVGDSFDFFNRINTNIDWNGLDIESSPEVNSRKRIDCKFHTYDGVNIPFKDEYFDVIYSKQVFEHVRYPESLLKEVCRVLKKDGVFIGSLSYLEPYHSYSIFNYTPYGWKTIVEDSGLKLMELRPGIDGIALIQRQFLGRPEKCKSWFDKSPLNEEIDGWGEKTKRNHRLINYRKIQYAGHIVFFVRKCT